MPCSWPNYVIDRGIRDEITVQSFETAVPEYAAEIERAWRESSGRIGLSWRKAELGLSKIFADVAADLRLLTAAADDAGATRCREPGALQFLTVEPTDADLASQATAVFRRTGAVWTLSFGGKTVHLPHSRGLGYIAELLRKPRVDIEAARLAGFSTPSTQLKVQSGILLSDEKTIMAVQRGLSERRNEMAGLQKADWSRRGVLQEEISKLEKYLGEVAAPHGKVRKVAGTVQRSRTAVTNAIKRAIGAISKEHPGLSRHLKESIRTGTAPVYAPVNVPDWQF